MEENKEPRQRMSKRSFYVDAFVCPLLPKNETKRLDVAGVVRDVDHQPRPVEAPSDSGSDLPLWVFVVGMIAVAAIVRAIARSNGRGGRRRPGLWWIGPMGGWGGGWGSGGGSWGGGFGGSSGGFGGFGGGSSGGGGASGSW